MWGMAEPRVPADILECLLLSSVHLSVYSRADPPYGFTGSHKMKKNCHVTYTHTNNSG